MNFLSAKPYGWSINIRTLSLSVIPHLGTIKIYLFMNYSNLVVNKAWAFHVKIILTGTVHQDKWFLVLFKINVLGINGLIISTLCMSRSESQKRSWLTPVSWLCSGVFESSSVASESVEQKEGRPKLSLRRFFSAMGLNGSGRLGKGRSSSMEQLSLSPKPGTSPSASPSPARAQTGHLRKAPSLQSLRLVSPLLPSGHLK